VTLQPTDEQPLEPLPEATNVTVPIQGSEATRKLLDAMRNPPVPEPPAVEPPPQKRANWLPAPAAFNLSMACVLVNKAFGDHFGCYLVGSSLRKRDYRDVDVRLIMSDAEFARLFGGGTERCPQLNPLWSLLCSSISLFLKTHTGLPVDFQIQQQTEANKEFGRPDHQRHPLGVFVSRSPLRAATQLRKAKASWTQLEF
jgi:hypothetical protein